MIKQIRMYLIVIPSPRITQRIILLSSNNKNVRRLMSLIDRPLSYRRVSSIPQRRIRLIFQPLDLIKVICGSARKAAKITDRFA